MPDVPLTSLAVTVITAVLAALVVLYGRRWQAAGRAADGAARRAAAAEAMLAAAPLGCLAIAQDGTTVHGAPALMEALGLDPEGETALGALFGAFLDADAERLSAAVSALRDEGSGFELTLARKDGARVLELRGARARAADGSSAAELIWVHDVTELARTVERAEAERDSVAGLLDALPLPVWRRDKDLKLVYCNRAYGHAVDEEPAAALSKAVELLGKAKSEAGRYGSRRKRGSAWHGRPTPKTAGGSAPHPRLRPPPPTARPAPRPSHTAHHSQAPPPEGHRTEPARRST